jgi:stage II sporulation protein AA (anti-sigma F factor antagonist)
LNISTVVRQGVLIVRLEGELDMHVADEFRRKVDNAIDSSGSRNLLLNLKGVGFIDSSGLGVILGRYKKIAALGGKVLITGARPTVARLLEYSGVRKIVKIWPTELAALENI